jgi:hypothetical protein
MKYYTLERLGAHNPHRWIKSWPYIKDVSFSKGKQISTEAAVPDPLTFPLKPLNPYSDDHGPEMTEFFKGTIPLFRDDFIEALKEFGVTNVDYYNALITDPDNGETFSNYKAANVIDEDYYNIEIKSNTKVRTACPPIARKDMYIVVNEALKDFLQAKGYTKIDFMEMDVVATGVGD